MKKFLIIAGITIVGLFIIGVFFLGTIVKAGIEKFGPQITKVSVNVGSAGVSILGSASINNLVVGNPHGYTSPQAIKVGTIDVSLAPFSMMSQKIVVHSVRVNAAEITFESGGILSNNLSAILDNVNGSAKSPQTESSGNSQSSQKIEIDDLVISGAKVDINLHGVISQSVPLPEIHLTNLGKDGNGLTPAEITRAILSAVLTGTLKAVGSLAGGVTKTVGSAAGSAAGGVTQAVSSVTSSVGNLLGGGATNSSSSGH